MTNNRIERIHKENYYMFDDLIYWRVNNRERTLKEKELSKNKRYDEAYTELENQNLFVFAAKYDERYVGWISIIYMPKIGLWSKGIIYIDELWTAPEYRKKGVAESLMKKSFECEHKTGAETIRLYVDIDNTKAQRLYEKCGFVQRSNARFMELKRKEKI